MQVYACIMSSVDAVFKALADPTRRELLDRLRERSGQTLGELCEGISMARQSTTQHLGILEAANLVSTARRGRRKLHYLNPVPLHDIQERWIEIVGAPSVVYVTYIESTPERVWDALTDPDMTAQYWGHSNVSEDWRPGSRWEHVRTDGSGIADVTGEVVESQRPHHLVTTWETSTVTFDIEPYGDIVRLTVTHDDLAAGERADAAAGWAAVLSNLKSLLETGHPLPQPPWEMSRSR
jgi:uncharacterized protein YndB with AHSA1/START domain/DNA-binding transcriptional ArsR family regulator